MSTKTTLSSTCESDDGYVDFEKVISTRIAAVKDKPVFTTNSDTNDLWNLYINNIFVTRRKHYDCYCCREFIKKYGGLTYISSCPNYKSSVLWEGGDIPIFFSDSVMALRQYVNSSTVNGVFLWDNKKWGNPLTGSWSHLSGEVDPSVKSPLKTADQLMAEKKEEFEMLSHALSDYNLDIVSQAVRVLDQGALYRSEKAVEVAKWFRNLYVTIGEHKRNNVIWYAVATAPPGFCHIRSTVISTLLDDIKNGIAFSVLSERWMVKLHPLRYQRPSTITTGNIDAAEKIVEKFRIASSLRRKWATLDDVLLKWWIPRPVPSTQSTGIFAALRPSPTKPLELPETKITVEKFVREILPDVLQIEVKLPSSGAYYGLCTAADSTSPPILQWDGLENHPRNPVSHYFYNGGSSASVWNLPSSGSWNLPLANYAFSPGYGKVAAIFPCAAHWQEPTKFSHQSDMLHFAIEGCKDSRRPGLALFPECLKSELREIRSTIEAYSNKGQIEGDGGNANGIAFQKSNLTPLTLRCTLEKNVETYILDRWS